MNELQMLHRFHQGTGDFHTVCAIESWWHMPITVKERMKRQWEAIDKAKKDLQSSEK